MHLADGDVHVWLVESDAVLSRPAILSEYEQNRLDNMKSNERRRQFRCSRTVLREVLSRYLNRPPRTIAIEHTVNGKPYVPDSTLEFNLSHTDTLILVAVTEQRAVGVDIETTDIAVRGQCIAERLFTEREKELVRGDPSQFTALWCRKEACIKATGLSVATLWERFNVDTDRVALTVNDVGTSLVLCDLDVPPGHAGALAVSGQLAPNIVRCMVYTEE